MTVPSSILTLPAYVAYYLLSCARSFRVGTRNQVYQLVLSKRRRPDYVVVR